ELPSGRVKRTQPTSSGRTPPLSRAQLSRSEPLSPKVLRKSPPVPRGTRARQASGGTGPPWKNPFTTSLRVPSPPTATMRRKPLRRASAVRAAACIGGPGEGGAGPAPGDDAAEAAAESLGGEGGGMHRALGERVLGAVSERAHHLRADLRPASAGRSARAFRGQHHAGAHP